MSVHDDAGGRIRRPRVVIVDDEPEVAGVLARAALANGFDPVVVTNGRDLIALRRAGPLPKVILITGYGEAFLGPPSILAGDALVGTLLKPFRDAELGAMLRRAV